MTDVVTRQQILLMDGKDGHPTCGARAEPERRRAFDEQQSGIDEHSVPNT